MSINCFPLVHNDCNGEWKQLDRVRKCFFSAEVVIDVSCTGAGEAVSIETLFAGAAVRAGSVDTISIGIAAVVLCGALIQIYTHIYTV